MDLSEAFRFVNLGVGVIIILGGIAQFFNVHVFQGFILGAYLILFGLAVGLLEVQAAPAFLVRYASFLFSFIGRGVFYVFIGSIILSEGWLRIIAGTIVGAVGLAYIALEFVPSVTPPSNMREADASWGAEQV